MENVESLCQTVWVASQLNRGKVQSMTGSQAKELIAVRKSLGMDDKRENWQECQLCDNAEFSPGTVCRIPDQPAASGSSAKLDPDAEKLVQVLTEQILAVMK